MSIVSQLGCSIDAVDGVGGAGDCACRLDQGPDCVPAAAVVGAEEWPPLPGRFDASLPRRQSCWSCSACDGLLSQTRVFPWRRVVYSRQLLHPGRSTASTAQDSSPAWRPTPTAIGSRTRCGDADRDRSVEAVADIVDSSLLISLAPSDGRLRARRRPPAVRSAIEYGFTSRLVIGDEQLGQEADRHQLPAQEHQGHGIEQRRPIVQRRQVPLGTCVRDDPVAVR